jgi:hypothetical protein
MFHLLKHTSGEQSAKDIGVPESNKLQRCGVTLARSLSQQSYVDVKLNTLHAPDRDMQSECPVVTSTKPKSAMKAKPQIATQKTANK